MCVAYIFTKLWTGKFFGLLARSSYKHHQLIDAHGLFRHLQQSHKATPKPFSRYARRQLARSPKIKAHRVFNIFFVSDFPFLVAWRGGDLRSWSLIHLRFSLGPNPPGAT